MVTQEQEDDPEVTPSILDIDYTPSHIAEPLSAQTNNRERYVLTEKMILDLINKNNESKELLNESKELLENNENLLHEQEDLLHERERLLVMSAQQLGKIQALEKQLEVVKGNPGDINTKQTPVFFQIPDTKANYKHFEHIEIAKYSNFKTNPCYSARVLKPKERAFIVDELTTVFLADSVSLCDILG